MDKKDITTLFRQYYGRMYGMAVSILYDGKESKNVFAYLRMRMENTWQKGINRLTDKTEANKRYANWFPCIYLSYNPSSGEETTREK